ncbi:MAG TPA: GAF domain-containing protein [Anaerolineae bacterium]
MTTFRPRTIRQRLLTTFLIVALLPTIGIGLGSAAVGYYTARQQAVDRLASVAARKELAIRDWVTGLSNKLLIAANTEGEPERLSVVLDLARDNKYYDFYNKAARNRLRGLVGQDPAIGEFFLVDLNGRVILSTKDDQQNATFVNRTVLHQALGGRYLGWPPASGPANERVLVALEPVRGADGQPLGVIGLRASLASLDPLLQERTGLGVTGKAYLVTRDRQFVAGVAAPAGPAALASGLVATIGSGLPNQGLYRDYQAASVVGVYRWLPDLGLALATEQNQGEAFGAVGAVIAVNLAVGLAGILLAIAAALFMARDLAVPIAGLVQTATRVAAGDLDQVAVVQSDDEIAALALAFNSMTAQLRELIAGLERRVGERTNALQSANAALVRRAVQLETSVRVSREITSILDVNLLLERVVELIRRAFGYYHVLIFLLDHDRDELVLAAGSGEADPQVRRVNLAQRSINTRAIQTRMAQIVNDVAQSPDFLRDDCLPGTRSEMIAPLMLGDQIIGTLDVHSVQVDGFSAEDALVIQGLGDQIAIAIENARLYDRSRELAVLEERNRLARELHDSVTQSLYSLLLLAEGWRRLASANSAANVDDYLSRIGEITQQALREMRLLILELRPPALESEGFAGALRHRLDAVEKRVGVDARLIMDDLAPLPPALDEALYRIAVEALNNALKHAAATVVTVRLAVNESCATLEVSDNGRGFNLASAGDCGGLGLNSMRERAGQVGGTLTIETATGRGTLVTAIVPYQRSEPREAA